MLGVSRGLCILLQYSFYNQYLDYKSLSANVVECVIWARHSSPNDRIVTPIWRLANVAYMKAKTISTNKNNRFLDVSAPRGKSVVCQTGGFEKMTEEINERENWHMSRSARVGGRTGSEGNEEKGLSCYNRNVKQFYYTLSCLSSIAVSITRQLFIVRRGQCSCQPSLYSMSVCFSWIV